MEINTLKEEKMVVEERAAQYLSDLNSFKSQNADVESALKELQNKLGYCENEKVLLCCCCCCFCSFLIILDTTVILYLRYSKVINFYIYWS